MNPLTRFIQEIINNGLEAFGRYYSCYRGFVSDNNDPQHLGRVKLMIPEITGVDTHEYWAFPKGNFSGKGYGTRITPRIGELVWVEFERGHLEVPIFSLGYTGKDEQPDDPDSTDPNVYWFISPAGHKVKINDTKKTISIQSAFGDQLVLNDQGISLVVDVKNKRQISLGKLNKSTYKAVKGDKVKDSMKDMKKVNDMLINALEASATGGSSYLASAAIKTALPAIKSLSGGIGKKIDDSMSDIVTLE